VSRSASRFGRCAPPASSRCASCVPTCPAPKITCTSSAILASAEWCAHVASRLFRSSNSGPHERHSPRACCAHPRAARKPDEAREIVQPSVPVLWPVAHACQFALLAGGKVLNIFSIALFRLSAIFWGFPESVLLYVPLQLASLVLRRRCRPPVSQPTAPKGKRDATSARPARADFTGVERDRAFVEVPIGAQRCVGVCSGRYSEACGCQRSQPSTWHASCPPPDQGSGEQEFRRNDTGPTVAP
jgi:hypothetical protein